MNKIEIEDYRGWTIYFDKEEDRFYSVAQAYDVSKTNKTFTAAKKAIDDYLKDNQNFKVFDVVSWNHYGTAELIPARIVGIRKDGRYLIKKSGQNEAEQLSTYDENNWILHKTSNLIPIQRYREACLKKKQTITALDQEIDQLKALIDVKLLSDLPK